VLALCSSLRPFVNSLRTLRFLDFTLEASKTGELTAKYAKNSQRDAKSWQVGYGLAYKIDSAASFVKDLVIGYALKPIFQKLLSSKFYVTSN
jgi:hypothetical protein